MQYFPYEQAQMDYLAAQDERLAQVIQRVGKIERPLEDSVLDALVKSIVGQQISRKAAQTINQRLAALVNHDYLRIDKIEGEALRSCGLSERKVMYLQRLIAKVNSHELDLEALNHKDDDEVIKILSACDGIGVWTAQMCCIFALARPNIISFLDAGIIQGIKLLYGVEKIDKALKVELQQRFAPYCSIASFYLWKVGNGEVFIE